MNRNFRDKRIRLVQGDSRPLLLLSVQDCTSGKPIDLSSAGTQALFKFRAVGERTVKSTMPCAKLPGMLDENNVVVYPIEYETPGSGGRLRVEWKQDTLDKAGEFEAELEVTFPDGTIQTLFDVIKFRIREEF